MEEEDPRIGQVRRVCPLGKIEGGKDLDGLKTESMATRKPKPFRVVVTGGPCAGKSSLCRLLASRFPEAVLVPEAATEVILSGQTPERLGQELFQQKVYERQVVLEREALRRSSFLICDRGLPDGLAYCPGIFHRLGVSLDSALRRYAVVLHLAVIPDSESYSLHCAENPARREDHARALVLEKNLRKIYSGHPSYHFLWGALEVKLTAAVRILLERRRAVQPCLGFPQT